MGILIWNVILVTDLLAQTSYAGCATREFDTNPGGWDVEDDMATRFNSRWSDNGRTSKTRNQYAIQESIMDSYERDLERPLTDKEINERRNFGHAPHRSHDPCGQAPLNPATKGANYRIIHGQNQTYGEWPSYVRLVISENENFGSLCGGVLISDRHILTAAHCVWITDDGEGGEVEPFIAEPEDIMVYLAENMLNESDEFQQEPTVKSVCVSKEFEPLGETTHDWALLKLSEAVAFDDYIQPACLPEKQVKIEGNSSVCYVVGAGVVQEAPYETDVNGDIDAERVKKLRVERVTCPSQYTVLDSDHSRECYENKEDPQGDSCPGDSGGPVLCLDAAKRWTVVALVSLGPACTEISTEPRVGTYAKLRNLMHDMKRQCKFDRAHVKLWPEYD